MHLLCRLGIHRWDLHTETSDGFIYDFNWCQRPGCRYELPLLVNRERSRLAKGPPPQQGPSRSAA